MGHGELEAAIDSHGLPRVLETLAEIAREKAEHVRVNWQDNELAKCWERDATALDACAAKTVH